MDISVKRSDDFIVEDRSWLASTDGTPLLKSVVLAIPLFTKATHYPNGVIRSGTFIAEATSGPHAGKYGPYDNAASDGRQNGEAALALWNTTPVRTDPLAPTYVGAPGQRRGVIDQANLPPNSGVDASLKTDLRGSFRFE
jgi:hypothetical protein